MQRYAPLFLAAFLVCAVLIVGSVYLSGHAINDDKKLKDTLTIYTTLPVENVAVLAEEYEKNNHIKLKFVPLDEKTLLARLKDDQQSATSDASLVLANKEFLIRAAAEGVFSSYVSEETDIIADQFKDSEGHWVGLWYDPMVFCANKDYLRSLAVLPTSWQELAKQSDCRIAITDFLAAESSANLLYTLVAEYDEARAFNLLEQLKPKIVKYSKYLVTPVRMAGMGEVDISIAVQSESLRYIRDGFPITLIYPTDGTSYMLTGAGILKNAANPVVAQALLHWLTGDEAQMCLQKNGFFFVPANQTTMAYKSFSGKNIVLFDNYSDLSWEQKNNVLDRWVKNIRFK